MDYKTEKVAKAETQKMSQENDPDKELLLDIWKNHIKALKIKVEIQSRKQENNLDNDVLLDLQNVC